MEHQRKPRSATATVRNDASSTPGDRFGAATRGGAVEVPYRRQMDAAFGTDFGDVRAYLGRTEIAEMGPEAIARDNQIAFATTNPSVELVAHELVHVVQARRHGTPSGSSMSSASDPAEHEADDIAARVARGEKVTVAGSAPRAPLQLRGPAYAGMNAEELAKYGVKPGETLIVLDDKGEEENSMNKATLLQRAGSGGKVRVQIQNTLRTIEEFPANLLDTESFHHSPNTDRDDMNTGGEGQSYFSTPKAYDVDDHHIYARWNLHTKNKWDRAAFEVRFPEKPTETLEATKTIFVDKSQWNNPAWDPDQLQRQARFVKYGFRDEFEGFKAHGNGDASDVRTINMKIPRNLVQGGPLTTSSTITVGMKVFYDDNGPTVATEKESAKAYGKPRQYHGWGIYKNELGQARIDLEAIKNKAGVVEGEWATPEEVWQRPLGANPSPNIVRPFPETYEQQHREVVPLRAPDKDFALATRIENEATLKLSSKEVLRELVTMLAALSEQPGRVNEIMHAGHPLLGQFEWSIHKENGGNPMLFTDKYMDDRRHTALRSGVGIRRRSTNKATKLNVKTGEGHNVGKVNDHEDGGYDTDGAPSDVYRRHEVGFDLNPEATPEQIGGYLGSGLNGEDPWNIGAIEANKTTQDNVGEDIDFSDLAYRLVLQGHRTKFRLEAKKDGRTINIELSCDHTVGRTFEEFAQNPDAVVHDDLESKYHHIYNLEMELEHLGASTLSQKQDQQPVESSKNEGPSESKSDVGPSTSKGGPSTSQGGSRDLPPRPDHPGRNYLGKDTKSPAFNTPSFQVFAHAKDQFLEFARNGYRDMTGLSKPTEGQELEKAPQKLEALYRAVQPAPLKHKKPKLGKMFRAFTSGYQMIESQHDDSLCAAVLPYTSLKIPTLQEQVPESLPPDERLLALAQLIKRKIVIVNATGVATNRTYGSRGEEARVVLCDGRYHALVKK